MMGEILKRGHYKEGKPVIIGGNGKHKRYFFSEKLYKQNKPEYLYFRWLDIADGEEVQFAEGATVGRTIITGLYVEKQYCIEREE